MDVLASSPVTLCMSKITLAAGSTTTVSNTGTITYCIRGRAYTKSAITNGATPTTDAAKGSAFRPIVANQGTIIIWGLDKDGNQKACQGSIEALDASGNFLRAPELPVLPNTMCPMGAIVLKGGATLASAWTFGSSNLSGVTGMTYLFVDLLGMPDRPFIS